MLKGISPLLTPDLLHALASMGHGDAIAIVDANFPLTPDDFDSRRLPGSVEPHRGRLFGLTIQPERLREIREERRPGSRYASLDNCRYEVREAEAMMQREGIPMLDTTTKSIEEIATTILHRGKLERRIF